MKLNTNKIAISFVKICLKTTATWSLLIEVKMENTRIGFLRTDL